MTSLKSEHSLGQLRHLMVQLDLRSPAAIVAAYKENEDQRCPFCDITLVPFIT